MATNAIGPVIVAKSVAPLLQKGNAAFCQQRHQEKKDFRGVILNMSAGVAGIGQNQLGGWYGYRMSKTGKNDEWIRYEGEFVVKAQKGGCISYVCPMPSTRPYTQSSQRSIWQRKT